MISPLRSRVNLSNLDTLAFQFPAHAAPAAAGPEDKVCTGWAIYAEPVNPKQPLGPVKQLGDDDEGFSCVDDVARIGLVYLDQWEKTGDPQLGHKAREAVRFCLNQHDGQGHFYNFVEKDGRLNTEGPTSRPGLNWWSARAFWALSRAERLLPEGELRSQVSQTLDLTVQRLEEERNRPIHPDLTAAYARLGVQPGGLVDNSGSVTSLFALGLAERLDARPELQGLLTSYCDAMTRLEQPADHPFLAHLHTNSLGDLNTVHLYGNHQVQALAEAGRKLGRPDWIDSARREADGGYPRLLASHMVPFACSPSPEPAPQIAYAAETTIANLQAVYAATGESKYSQLAGLFGTWFGGSNISGQPVYHPETGRAFDGVDPHGVSINSGAESNVEAQLAMSYLAGTPGETLLGLTHTRVSGGEQLRVGAELPVVSGQPRAESRTLNGGAVRAVSHLAAGDALQTPDSGFLTWRSPGGTPLEIDPDGDGPLPARQVLPIGAASSWQVTAVPAGVTLSGDVVIDSLTHRAEQTVRTWSDGEREVSLQVGASGEWRISEK